MLWITCSYLTKNLIGWHHHLTGRFDLWAGETGHLKVQQLLDWLEIPALESRSRSERAEKGDHLTHVLPSDPARGLGDDGS